MDIYSHIYYKRVLEEGAVEMTTSFCMNGCSLLFFDI